MSSSRPTSQGGSTAGSFSVAGVSFPSGAEVSVEYGTPVAQEMWATYPKTAAKPSGASTHRVIPEKCEYARGMLIPGAPKVPLSPKTAADHPDLLVAAQQKIRKFVASNYRSWPACNCSNRNVDIDFQYDHHPDMGAVLMGYFQCEDCGRR